MATSSGQSAASCAGAVGACPYFHTASLTPQLLRDFTPPLPRPENCPQLMSMDSPKGAREAAPSLTLCTPSEHAPVAEDPKPRPLPEGRRPAGWAV